MREIEENKLVEVLNTYTRKAIKDHLDRKKGITEVSINLRTVFGEEVAITTQLIEDVRVYLEGRKIDYTIKGFDFNLLINPSKMVFTLKDLYYFNEYSDELKTKTPEAEKEKETLYPLSVNNVIEIKNSLLDSKHERIKQLKQQWSEIKQSGYDDIDPEVIEHCEWFNSIPNVATTWSCSGHLDIEEGGTRHISFITLEEDGGVFLEALRDTIVAFSNRDFRLNIRLVERPLYWKFLDFNKIPLKDKDKVYMSWFLNISMEPSLYSVDEAENLIKEFFELFKATYKHYCEE